MRRLLPLVLLLSGCPSPTADLCADPATALADCHSPLLSEAHYVEQAELYFDSMDRDRWAEIDPDYHETVARWEWPPWLKLTAWTEEHILLSDRGLRATYPSIVPFRDCRFFAEQPFARCRVEFIYDDPDHEGRACPIYEEFFFDEDGEITWIEAWSDLPGYLPMDADVDPWAEGEVPGRLGARIPGLGAPDGRIDPESAAMAAAAETDPDIADFIERTRDWSGTWFDEFEAAGDDLWERGCGW